MTKVMDISGMGGGYERACHNMIYKWLKATKENTFEEIFPNGKLDDKFDKLFSKLVERINPSGAMWGASLSHFSFIKKQGTQAWLKKGEELDRIIDIPRLRILVCGER